MTKFVHYYVVLQVRREEDELVAEIEILERSAAAPASLLIANSNTIVTVAIELVPEMETREHQLPRLFFMGKVVGSDARVATSSAAHAPK